MRNKLAQLLPENTYHVYNRTNGKDKLFKTKANYNYFLPKYQEYISPVADTFAYCLMPNHFHFLIRCKGIHVILDQYNENLERRKRIDIINRREAIAEVHLSHYISKQFSNLFNAYTQAFNKQERRHGSLFSRPFNRILVDSEAYRSEVVRYIHNNPVDASICMNRDDWPHSSYNIIIGSETSFICSDEVLSWFGTKENFISYCNLE